MLGPELTFLFNDTCFPLLGPRLERALGARFDEVRADALDQAAPVGDEAFATARHITAQKNNEAALRLAGDQLRHSRKVERPAGSPAAWRTISTTC